MAIEAIIFDLDDTLWRCIAPPDWAAITALQAAELQPHGARLGFGHLDFEDFLRGFWPRFDARHPEPSDPDALEERRWSGGPPALREILAERGVTCADEDAVCLWDAINAVPQHRFNQHLYPDAVTTLRTLRGSGYRLAVVTARPWSAALAERELYAAGLNGTFELFVTSGEVGFRKPHPILFETALSALGLQPDQTAFVGDSYEADIVPAATLGMTPILKLNDRAPDPAWSLAHHQIPALADLLLLDCLRIG